MKTNELRIGNYVSYYNIWHEIVRHKIVGIEKDRVLIEYNNGETDYYDIDYIEPIELTEEVLLKIGFKKNKYDWWKYFPDRENEISILMTDNYTIIEYANLFHCPEDVTEVNYGSTLEFPRRIYLHKLQNAYYLLTGQELNIEL
jgi:hypothetical protein